MAGTAKKIEFDLDETSALDELTQLLEKKKIKVGRDEFLLTLFTHPSLNDAVLAGFLRLLARYLLLQKSKHEHRTPDMVAFDKESNKYFLYYFKQPNVKKLESKIEKDFNVKIELEKKNPLDEVFGIWKNEDVSLAKIRAKAWQRSS